tara:strand:+ start:2727 stop:3128 length:402 start_codon:yes stop_codon:yes gene_type:complete
MQTVIYKDLKHVIYVSRPTHFDHMVLDNILKTSRFNNLEAGVTGNLICHSDLFLQMLEGPAEAVGRLYERILADDRHADIVKLRDETSKLKLFPTWSMRNDSHQSWMLSRAEIANMSSEDSLKLFERLAKEIS